MFHRCNDIGENKTEQPWSHSAVTPLYTAVTPLHTVVMSLRSAATSSQQRVLGAHPVALPTKQM